MIELLLSEHKSYYDDMILLSNIIAWLTTEIAKSKDKEHPIMLHGYIIVYDEKAPIGHYVSAMMFCEGENQRQISEILQQPPGEYKEKYIARTPTEEPEVVSEETISINSDSDYEDDEDTILRDNEDET